MNSEIILLGISRGIQQHIIWNGSFMSAYWFSLTIPASMCLKNDSETKIPRHTQKKNEAFSLSGKKKYKYLVSLI